MTRIRKLILPSLPALLVGAVLASPAGAQDRGRGDYRSWIDTTFAFASGGLVDASQVAGDVEVTTWERSEVRVEAWAQHGTVQSQFSRDRVVLRVEGERDGNRNRRIGESGYRITVPRGTRVKVASVSGDVAVSGTGAEVEASSVSGDVSVADAGGITTVKSVSGDVEVSRVSGDLVAQSVSGDVEAESVQGDVRASTVSGDLMLRGLRSRAVSAKSTSGDLDFQGPLDAGGRYEFRSHSGNVTVRVPDGTGAEVSFSSFSGGLESDFPVTIGGAERRRGGRDMDFRLGGGGARLALETFSGDARLLRTR